MSAALRACLAAILLVHSLQMKAQDNRTQYPGGLTNSYFTVNVGYINYPFTNANLEPGYTAQSITIPHVAVRIVLFGHQFNKYLSAEVSYMRPVKYAAYYNINGDKETRHAWMHSGTLTLRSKLPLGSRFGLYGEAGIAVSTRSGFEINNQPVMKDVNTAAFAGGAGLEYKLSSKWDFIAGATIVTGNSKEKQPRTTFISGGFRLNMRSRTPAQLEAAKSDYIFPRNLIQVGYATNGPGYAVNNFVSKTIPIFWGGGVEVRRGAALRYQRNVYHTRKVFAFDIGASASYWQTRINRDEFFTLSVFPSFRFNVLRTRPLDLYLNYSVAGPSYISKDKLDGLDTGNGFTFQDFMGMGVFAGKNRHFNAEININHYSNGNIFPENAGVKIPMTFSLGYAF
ncbi:MAG TPA: acyloxyacyl hydrolase [Flavisolibacter sp.]|jgi:opacity protein-like surface antigen|nr:acyloxyacyl hydrolase [Flavisolibacter sp.]